MAKAREGALVKGDGELLGVGERAEVVVDPANELFLVVQAEGVAGGGKRAVAVGLGGDRGIVGIADRILAGQSVDHLELAGGVGLHDLVGGIVDRGKVLVEAAHGGRLGRNGSLLAFKELVVDVLVFLVGVEAGHVHPAAGALGDVVFLPARIQIEVLVFFQTVIHGRILRGDVVLGVVAGIGVEPAEDVVDGAILQHEIDDVFDLIHTAGHGSLPDVRRNC